MEKETTDQTKKPAFVRRSLNVVDNDYTALLRNLKETYRKAQIKAAVKVNAGLLEYYWEMGRQISDLQKGARYGSAFFDSLSLDLKAEFPKETGFSSTNIKYITRWYKFYNQDIVNRQQAADVLGLPADFGLIPWFHHVLIFTKSKTVNEALFYIEETIKNNWSRSQLEQQISNKLYSKQGKAVTNFEDKLPAPTGSLAKEILKSPYNLSFIEVEPQTERQLEDAIVRDITRFLLELGHGFAYVGRQMELNMPGGQTFIPDLIFYHTVLKCYIVVELKIVPFMPEFVGKLNFYVSAVDELMKQDDDNPTIGLLICRSKDDTVVEWSFRGVDRPLGIADYERTEKAENVLPTISELQRIIDGYYPKGT